jgi:hypothetical protein
LLRAAVRIRLVDDIDDEVAALVAIVAEIAEVHLPRIVDRDVLPVDVLGACDPDLGEQFARTSTAKKRARSPESLCTQSTPGCTRLSTMPEHSSMAGASMRAHAAHVGPACSCPGRQAATSVKQGPAAKRRHRVARCGCLLNPTSEAANPHRAGILAQRQARRSAAFAALEAPRSPARERDAIPARRRGGAGFRLPQPVPGSKLAAMTTPPHARAASAPREELAAPATRPWSRRDLLALGIVALPAAGLLAARGARAQDFTQVPIPPDAARADSARRFLGTPAERNFRAATSCVTSTPPASGFRPSRCSNAHMRSRSKPRRMRDHAHPHLDQARAAVARLVGAEPEEIALMRNATEAMNVVARGLDLARGDEVILTTHEHPGGAAPWVARARTKASCCVFFTPSFDAGRDAEALWTLASKRTRAIMVSHVHVHGRRRGCR